MAIAHNEIFVRYNVNLRFRLCANEIYVGARPQLSLLNNVYLLCTAESWTRDKAANRMPYFARKVLAKIMNQILVIKVAVYPSPGTLTVWSRNVARATPNQANANGARYELINAENRNDAFKFQVPRGFTIKAQLR